MEKPETFKATLPVQYVIDANSGCKAVLPLREIYRNGHLLALIDCIANKLNDGIGGKNLDQKAKQAKVNRMVQALVDGKLGGVHGDPVRTRYLFHYQAALRSGTADLKKVRAALKTATECRSLEALRAHIKKAHSNELDTALFQDATAKPKMVVKL